MKKQKRAAGKPAKKRDPKTVLWIPLLLGAGCILYYIIGPARGYMTSDCTDSLRWSYATYTSGRLISDEFWYAAILPFGGNLIFLPFIALFGYSMTAQICGLVTYALLLCAALFYLARGLGYGKNAAAGLTSVVVLILSSSPKLREIMWEHIFYYNLGFLFFCFGFGLAVRVIRDGGVCASGTGKTADWVRLGVLLGFSVLAATDGLQTLVCFTVPLLAGIFAERFFDGRETMASRRNRRTLLLVLALLAASCIGYLLIIPISHGVTAGYADGYSSYSAMSEWSKNFLNFFNNWFSLLGVSAASGDPLVSAGSIGNMVGIVGGLLLLAAPVVLLCRYSKLESRPVKVLLIGHLATCAFLLFAVTFGKLGNANWRLTPMLGTSVLVSVVTAYELLRKNSVLKRAGAVLLAFLIVMSGISAGKIAAMPADYGRDNSWHVAARELEARGLKYGYANFWWAEAITMLSDNAVQVANITVETSGPVKRAYQIPYDSYDDKDTDRYFLLLTEQDQDNLSNWLALQEQAGRFLDTFQIESEPYDLRGHRGTTLYVYVMADNLFG